MTMVANSVMESISRYFQLINEPRTPITSTYIAIITFQVDILIALIQSPHQSYKCQRALSLSIPVLSVDFVHDSIRDNNLPERDNYVALGLRRHDQLRKGQIKGRVVRRTVVSSEN